jgi:hypothetical protein
MQPTVRQLNFLNIGLMLASALAAFAFPFELFLFSYAVLGPLHYLTEISWLHDRRYFTAREKARRPKPHRAWLIFVAVTMVVIVASFVAVEGAGLQAQPKWEITFFYLVFVSALFTGVVEDRTTRIVIAAVTILLLVLLARSRYYILGAFFLVTIIHVLIFTASFILYGVLRERSVSGLVSLAVFIVCVVSFFLYAPASHVPAGFITQSYRSFNGLNAELLKLFHLGTGTTTGEIYESQNGLVVMRLIAFAYTYHYLNWFSKTSIIKWHEVPRSRTVMIMVIWLAALAIYAYDYDTGMAVLYFMSILHVMLEFPLNHRTFRAIGKEMYALVATGYA